MMYCAVRKTDIASETTVGNQPRRVLHFRALKSVLYYIWESNECAFINIFDIYMSKGYFSLSCDVAHRTVKSWRQNSFGCFSRWPCNTLRNHMCGVACCRKEWGKALYDEAHRARVVGGRKTVNRKIKLSAVFLQPIQNPSYMSHVLLLAYHFYAYWLYFIYVWHVYVSPKTYKWFGTFIIKDGRCAVGGVRHPQHTQTRSNSYTIASDSSNGVTNIRCCRYSCMLSW
jgi:hypothetical protein